MSIERLERLDAATIQYPEEYLIEEADMPDTARQSLLSIYLFLVLKHLYHEEGWMVAINRAVHDSRIHNSKQFIAPDVGLWKDIHIPLEEQEDMSRYVVQLPQRPAPPLVIEIASKDTWLTDIGSETHHKPNIYGRIGVKEYFSYDPNTPQYWTGAFRGLRLVGWRYENEQPIRIEPNERGWLRSEILNGYVSAFGKRMHIRDLNGNILQAGEEAAEIEANQNAADRDLERFWRLQAEARADREAERAEQERAEKEATSKIVEQERAEKEAIRLLAEKEAEAKAKLQAENDELRRAIEELKRQQQSGRQTDQN
jgi:hypothetical protein